LLKVNWLSGFGVRCDIIPHSSLIAPRLSFIILRTFHCLFFGYLVIWLFGYLVIWLSGYLVIWLFGYMVIWLFGYLVIWLSDYLVIWLSGYLLIC